LGADPATNSRIWPLRADLAICHVKGVGEKKSEGRKKGEGGGERRENEGEGPAAALLAAHGTSSGLLRRRWRQGAAAEVRLGGVAGSRPSHLERTTRGHCM